MTLILFQGYLFAGCEYNASFGTHFKISKKKNQILLISTELAVTLRLASFKICMADKTI